MAIEDKSQPSPLSRKPLPPFSPKDEKKAQQELARLRRNKKRGFEGKTLWDWLQLLGVPIFLALATIGFGFVQFYLADQQHVQDQKLAQQQHADYSIGDIVRYRADGSTWQETILWVAAPSPSRIEGHH